MDLFHPRCQCFAWGRCAWCSTRGQERHQANCQGDGSTGAVLRCWKSHFFTKLQLWRKFFEMILEISDFRWTSYVGKVRSQFIMIFGVGQDLWRSMRAPPPLSHVIVGRCSSPWQRMKVMKPLIPVIWAQQRRWWTNALETTTSSSSRVALQVRFGFNDFSKCNSMSKRLPFRLLGQVSMVSCQFESFWWWEFPWLSQPPTPAVSPCQACSILIRGANEFMLEEASRSVPRSTWYPKKNSCQTVKHVVNIMYLFYVVLVVSAWKNKIIKLIKQLLFHPRILHPLLSNSIWQVLKGAWCSMRCISNLGVQCSGSWGRCGRDCAQPALRGAFSCCQSHRAHVFLGCFQAIFWGRVGFFEEVHRT